MAGRYRLEHSRAACRSDSRRCSRRARRYRGRPAVPSARTRHRLRVLAGAAVVLLALLALAAAGGYFWLQQQFEAPGPAAAASRILIEPRARDRKSVV